MSHRRRRRHQKRSYRTKRLSHAFYMGIDWGKSDIGIALAEKETCMAFAYTTLRRISPAKALEEIGRIIQEKGVREVIIGIPSPINRQEVEYESERVGEFLEMNYGVVVHYQNEMFSTKLAEENLKEKGIRGISRYDDQEAARIILQDWLDRKTLGNDQEHCGNAKRPA